MENRPTLLQEEYVKQEHGPWKVLVVCQFLNRTTWKQAEPALEEFFKLVPSPDAMPRAVIVSDELESIVKPLGLALHRLRNLIFMTAEYREAVKKYGKDYDRYPVLEFDGCGRYAEDAWKLFVLKQACAPKDKQLLRYAAREKLLSEETDGKS
jgi:endonuclease III